MSPTGAAKTVRVFRIPPGRAQEGTEPCTAVPATVAITIDDPPPVGRDWPAGDCEGVSAGGLRVLVTDDHDDGFTVRPTCQTVYTDR